MEILDYNADHTESEHFGIVFTREEFLNLFELFNTLSVNSCNDLFETPEGGRRIYTYFDRFIRESYPEHGTMPPKWNFCHLHEGNKVRVISMTAERYK